jgi:hypothetical protein
VVLEHEAHEALHEREIVFDGFAAGNDLRFDGELEFAGVRGEVGADFRGELRARRGDVAIEEHHRAMPARFAEAAEGIHQHAIGGAEETVGERDREIPVDGDALLDGARLFSHSEIPEGIQGSTSNIQRPTSNAQ